MIDSTSENSDVQSAAHAKNLALQGDTLYIHGKYQAAFDCFSEAVRLRPLQPAYHYRLASASWKLGRSEDVDRHYTEAIRLNPRHPEAHKVLAQWLVTQGKMDRALHHSGMALELAPEDFDVRVTRVAVLAADGQQSEAWEILEPLITSDATAWHLAVAYARLAPKIGHEIPAMALIQRALAKPGLSRPEESALHFSAAALLDSMGNYDEAFSHARLANEMARRTFDSAAYSKWVDDAIRYHTPRRLRSLPRATHENARPIFIVGMPRSGTTLLEQILSNHAAIFGGGELTTLNKIAASLAKPDWAGGAAYPDCLDSLSIGVANRLAADYLREISALDADARYVTDKMPHNFEHLWLAEVLVPDSHVIHCIRDPRDTCLSCYFTDFNEGNAFSFDLAAAATFYRDYRRLMDHWTRVVSLPVLEVRYEDLVADLGGQVGRILDFLDLPWDKRCLDFHNNTRRAITASRDQVRKPLYRSSVGRWKHYERHIPELLDLT